MLSWQYKRSVLLHMHACFKLPALLFSISFLYTEIYITENHSVSSVSSSSADNMALKPYTDSCWLVHVYLLYITRKKLTAYTAVVHASDTMRNATEPIRM